MGNFLSLFESFKISDLVDIGMLSIILYQFFSIIQGTRAVQVLVGTATITILYWFSLSFELYSINWLLKHFFDYFFIILIILFQDQIRAALALLGNTKLFGRRNFDEYHKQIEEVVMACSALSKDKKGALIVFERFHGLLNYSSTGTRMNSEIHADIIFSIFQPSSPLHDGAIILYQNRIQSAGCFLPLSKTVDLARQYGTRHRAALGVSEVSDAIVVVISEETGQLSLCFNGKFQMLENEKELRKNLRLLLFSSKDLSDKTVLQRSLLR